MRQYKFRAWDNVNKKMYFEELESILLNRKNAACRITVGGIDQSLCCIDVGCGTPPIILMQCTGLQDKNGDNEIYECDIIDTDGNVIGNEYETPALLEEETNLLIQGFGTKNWLTTYTQAVERGCHDA